MTSELEAQSERILRAQARREGLSYHDYCIKHGLLDESAERQIERREVPLNEH